MRFGKKLILILWILCSASALEAKTPQKPELKPENAKSTLQLSNFQDPQAPILGNPDASITVIEFADYQCPFCAKAQPAVKKVLQEYGQSIRYEIRDYPLPFHAQAKNAAMAANCAQEQGQYQAYAPFLWANQKKLKDGNLRNYARKAKLDLKKFDTCFKDESFDEKINANMRQAEKIPLAGVPVFLIFSKGILVDKIEGARPYSFFTEILDQYVR